MRNKKPISRVLVTLLSTMMIPTSIPLNLFTAFAEGGGAGGGFSGGGTGVTVVSDNFLGGNDIGLRFSLVTKDSSGTRVIENIYGKYYLDIWDSDQSGSFESWYGAVNSYSRYSPLPTDANIERWSDVDFDDTIATLISMTGKGKVNMNIANYLNPGGIPKSVFFSEQFGKGLAINGELFYEWFMEKVGTYNGEPQSRYFFFINAIYDGKTHGIDMDNTFLVVEPVLHLANPKIDGADADKFKLLGTEYIASWYGYVEGNLTGRGVEVGCSTTLRDRFSKIANSFLVTDTEHMQRVGMKEKVQDVLGITVPTNLYKITNGAAIAYGDGNAKHCWKDLFAVYNSHYQSNGFAMQIFWLKDIGGPGGSGTPIDTFDITTNPKDTPENSEPPSEEKDDNDTTIMDTKGSKTIIKMYVDLYKDPNTGYYTQIIDKDQFVRENVSNSITISDEEKINGYKVSAWYTSGEEYKDLPKGSSMLATKDIGITDGTVKLSSLGGKQLRVNNYTTATGYAAVSGGKSYYGGLASPHGGTNGEGLTASCTSEDANPYTTYKRLEVSGTSNYGDYNFPVNTDTADGKAKYIELDYTENTLVILYTREMSYISTTDTSVTTDKDERKDNSGELTIVKLYGTINPSTYEIEDIKSTTLTNTTRNVNIHNETGYDFAEWIYVTSGEQTVKNASVMGDPDYCSFDGTVDQAYRLDGFVDGFKNNSSLKLGFQFNGNFPEIYTITGTDHLSEEEIVGRYSYGSRSGIGDNTYNSTIYFGGTENLADGQVDGSDSNDVLYLLFLKNDQLTYAADDLVIPQSYLTRYDNYKHNPMTVTGSVSGNTHNEYLQEHKFKYVLPVITATEYKELNPLFIPHIKKPTGLYFFCLFSKKQLKVLLR